MYKFIQFLWIVFIHVKYEIIYYLLGLYAVIEDLVNHKNNKCDPIKKTGEVAVITGGARGLGAVVVKKLLECDMHVIIGCRNIEMGKNVIQSIREAGIETGSAEILHLDLASLSTVKYFANCVLKETKKLNLLINNAGIMFPPYTETVDGLESQWAVNYLGHFYLTHLLLNKLIETGDLSESNTRIINITSCAHHAGFPFDYNDMNMKNNYIPSAAYSQSKLAQLMFTKELNRLLTDKNFNVRVIAVHPGVVNTDIFNGTFVKILFPWVIKLFFKTPEQGAISVLFASVSPKLNFKGGIYISNCQETFVSKLADDPVQQQKLFKHTLSSLNIGQFGQTDS